MVYLEQQSAYLNQFSGSPIAPLLKEILKKEWGGYSSDIHNAGDLALNLLISLKTNNQSQAEKYYAMFTRRQPTKDSHWIYDNYILFALVCTVRKFEVDPQWIRNVIDLSYSTADPTNKKIKDTFKSVLYGNYNAKGDFHQISVVYQALAKEDYYDNETINAMFHYLWTSKFPFFEDDFLNVISLKAIEIAFLKKALLTDREFYYLNGFLPSFNSRADLIAKIVARLLIICLIYGVFYLLWKMNNMENQLPIIFKAVTLFGSFSGVGALAIWGWKNNLATFFRLIINKIFNYKTS